MTPSIKIYEYKGCETCRKALKWLDARGLKYERAPIRETPPTKAELEAMLGYYKGELRRLFNTSGGDYKQLGLSEKLPSMTRAQALELLSKNGNLVKRPFLLTGKAGLVGFKEDEWAALLKTA
jgi:arsenate reductase